MAHLYNHNSCGQYNSLILIYDSDWISVWEKRIRSIKCSSKYLTFVIKLCRFSQLNNVIFSLKTICFVLQFSHIFTQCSFVSPLFRHKTLTEEPVLRLCVSHYTVSVFVELRNGNLLRYFSGIVYKVELMFDINMQHKSFTILIVN